MDRNDLTEWGPAGSAGSTIDKAQDELVAALKLLENLPGGALAWARVNKAAELLVRAAAEEEARRA